MQTQLAKKTEKKSIADKALFAMCFAAASMPTAALANAAEKDPLEKWNDYSAAKGSAVGFGEGSGITNTLGNLFNILKVAFVLIGFGLFGGGVLRVVKASKTEGQQSQAPGWIMIALGSMLSVAGFLFFAFGQGIQDAVTGGGSNS